jgi:hypothetical protein
MLFISVFFILNIGISFAKNTNDEKCNRPYTLKINQENIQNCPQLAQFISDNRGSDLYMVYSEPFLKNPASLFGHVFILFTKNDPKSSISGFTLNFEAIDNSTNSMQYIYRGITGKFLGQYNFKKKFYQNLKVYNNYEDRDLTLYKIKATDNEKLSYLLKAWEYGTNQSNTSYYFFGGNCAYYMTNFLDLSQDNEGPAPLIYSPKQTLSNLKSISSSSTISLPSIKKEILLLDQDTRQLSHLIADAKFNLYQKERGIKNNNYKSSLIKLNQYRSENSNEDLKEIKLQEKNNFIPYSVLSTGFSSNNQMHISGALVDNKYLTETGLSDLNLFSYQYNEFNKIESNFTLISMSSRPTFEKRFQDFSWDFSLNNQRKESFSFNSTNLNIGLGVTKQILEKPLFISLLVNSIVDPLFIDLYPSIELFNSFDKLQLKLIYGQRFRKNHIKAEVFYPFSNTIQTSITWEEFEKLESRQYLGVHFRL